MEWCIYCVSKPECSLVNNHGPKEYVLWSNWNVVLSEPVSVFFGLFFFHTQSSDLFILKQKSIMKINEVAQYFIYFCSSKEFSNVKSICHEIPFCSTCCKLMTEMVYNRNWLHGASRFCLNYCLKFVNCLFHCLN